MKKLKFITAMTAVALLFLSTLLMIIPKMTNNYSAAIEYTGDQYVTKSTITSSEGEGIGNGGTIVISEKYELSYDWELPDNTFYEGDKLLFSIPPEFTIVETFNFPLNVDGEEVAQAKIMGNDKDGYYIEMTFTTNYVETHSDVNGTFNMMFILNSTYIKEGGDVTITFPDTEITVEVPSFGGGEGGGAIGNGNANENLKKGLQKDVNMIDPITGEQNDPTTVLEWTIALGKDTILGGKANTLDDIDKVIISDAPSDQRLIPANSFDKNMGNAFGIQKAFYTTTPFAYNEVSESDMNLKKNAAGEYFESFSMDALPHLKYYEEEVAQENSELEEWHLVYFTVPLFEVEENTEFSNNATITVYYKDSGLGSDEWTLSATQMWNVASGSIGGKVAGVTMTKIDAESDQALAGAEFDLYKKTSSGDKLIKEGVTSDNDGKVRVEKLTTGEYYFIETKSPEGYENPNNEKIEFNVTTADLVKPNQEVKYKDIGNIKNRKIEDQKTSVTVTKKWEDNNDQDGKRPNEIQVQLYADGEKEGNSVSLNESNNWTTTWSDLNEKLNGNVINYSVEEVGSIAGYESDSSNKNNNEIIITNTYKPDTTEIKGNKTWEDKNDQDHTRPTTITVNLLANGEVIDSKEVTSKNDWEYEFTNLPKYKDGEKINYTVTEDTVPDYSTEINGTNIINSYTPGKTSVTVTKRWEDDNNQDGKRPNTIQVQLLADGNKKGESVHLNEGNNWTTTWTELDDKSNGNTISYTVEEVSVENGYSSEINNDNQGNIIITNSFTQEKTAIKGTKTWDDKDNQDNQRPTTITVNLLADGELVESKEVTAADNWKYEFTNLPKYSEGNEINYRVTEDSVPGYSTEINGTDITNSYTPGKTSVSVTKRWIDDNDGDGKRPNSIQVQLYADGETKGEPVTLNEQNDWSTTWSDLDEKVNGTIVKYTVKEMDDLPDYEVKVKDEDHGNIIIENWHFAETIDLNGMKIWDDNDNKDMQRPTSITVNLLALGRVVDSVEVTEATDWKYEFTNLPKYYEGEVVNYTVTEDIIPGYSTEINGTTIKNSYTPGKTSATVTKRWEDNNNQDGQRPTVIQVQLLADGEKSGDPISLNEGNDWTTTWTDLDEKSNGKTIIYTVEEVNIGQGYQSEVNNQDQGNIIITNTYNIDTTEINGTKIWNDNDNQDGKRPSSIIVNLLADGEQIDSQEVLATNNWKYDFKNLPKYKDGEEITYTVTENSVPDYSTEIIGSTIKNDYTPGKTSVTVTKRWEDNNDQDGKRPNDIEVQLYANENAHGSPVVLNEGNNWTTTWTELDMNFEEVPIRYTVGEVVVSNGYETEVNPGNPGNIILTNYYTPETTEINGNKKWDDNEDQDGTRPTAITVNLLADGKLVDTKVVTKDTNWTYEFTNLPKNNNGEEISYTVTENAVPDYTAEISGTTITNKYTPGKTSVRVTKRWEDGNNQDGTRPNDIKVQLFADGKAQGNSVVLNEGNSWTTSWDELEDKKAGKTIDYTVQEVDEVNGYQTTIKDSDKGNIILTNSYDPETTEIKGNKTWNDKEDQDGERPTTISVNLLANGEIIDTKEVTKANNWSYEFTNLPKNQAGEKIIYTVTEDTIPNYSTEIAGTAITNNYTPGETSVTVTKRWEDKNNQDGKRANDIEVQLYANGNAHGNPVVLNEGNAWTTTWTGLDDKTDGTKIEYTVAETETTDGYNLTVNDTNQGNIILTNSYTPEEIEINGSKSWGDKENQDGERPTSITVNLLANGKIIDTKIVTEKENWTYAFTGLAKNEEGKEIQYTVTENTVPSYSTEVTGTDITNDYTPGETSVTVTKRWEDNNNQDGIRPNDIKVQLYANGKKQGDEVVLNDGNKWTTTWNELDEKKAGQTIVYTVQEVESITGYETIIQDDNHGNIILTNSYTPEETNVEGSKTWKDKKDQDGERPTAITVNLLANGKVIETQEVTEKENWTYSFMNLPKYEAGTEILYTITENIVPGYTVDINGADLTNNHTPGETSVTVTKRWEDSQNQDGIRPDDIEVQLVANGKNSGDPVVLNEENSWMTTWTGLDEKKDGDFIVYTVQEVDNVVGYKTTIDGVDHGNIIITNSYTPEETELKGTKKWDDNDNQDGKRPTSITMNLLGNGTVIATKEVTETDGWTYEFTNLPKNEAGEEILYTVTENTVPGYTTEINGTDITNHYTPGKTSIAVTKRWEDGQDKDKIRPNDIKVQLYADGKSEGNPITLNKGNDWTTTWSELDEKVNGKTIDYHVEEVSKVKGYMTTIDASNQGNLLITNSYTPKAPTPGGKSSNGVSSQSSSSSRSTSNSKTFLPTTGESAQIWFVIVGILLVGITVFIFWSKYKK